LTSRSIIAAIVDRDTFNAHIIETGTQSYSLGSAQCADRRKPHSGPKDLEIEFSYNPRSALGGASNLNDGQPPA
jgi:hypothetical protein